MKSWTRRNLLRTASGLVLYSAFRDIAQAKGGAHQPVYEWTGIGFGIDMSLEIYGVDKDLGDQLGALCEAEIAKLEKAFSLYLEDSELKRLNRDRRLENPTIVFHELMGKALNLEERTRGFYRPGIHGAWQWLVENSFPKDPSNYPDWLKLCAASAGENIRQKEGFIEVVDPLIEISMNAIGQGYLADRVAAILRSAEVESALLHLGETYALGSHPSGRLWKLAVMGTGELGLVGNIEFKNSGLAVSANEPGRLLIDPVNRRIHREERVAAVASAEGACVADAFATAFAVSPPESWEELAESLCTKGPAIIRIWKANQLAFSEGS